MLTYFYKFLAQPQKIVYKQNAIVLNFYAIMFLVSSISQIVYE